MSYIFDESRGKFCHGIISDYDGGPTSLGKYMDTLVHMLDADIRKDNIARNEFGELNAAYTSVYSADKNGKLLVTHFFATKEDALRFKLII